MYYKASKYNILIKKNKKNALVYNSYSGALSNIDMDIYEQICNNDLEDIKYKDVLISQGYIVNSNLNEINKVICEHNSHIYSKNSSSLIYVIAPTLLCNMNCVYCFENNTKKFDGFDEKTQDIILSYIKKDIIKNPSLKLISINWFGGEPLLKYNEIISFSKKLIEICKEKNITYVSRMVTNGLLLTKEKAKILKEQCNLKLVQITLDGIKENYCKLKRTAPENFDKVINNICDICDILKVNIRLNTNRENFEDMKLLTKHLLLDKNLKNKIFIYIAELKNYDGYSNYSNSCCLGSTEFVKIKSDFNYYLKTEFGLEDYQDRMSLPRSVSCGLCISQNVVIGPKGELYRCEHNIGRPNAVIGRCDEERYYTDFDLQYLTFNYNKKCIKCPWFPTCFGGCKNEIIQQTVSKDFCSAFKLEQRLLLKAKEKLYHTNKKATK